MKRRKLIIIAGSIILLTVFAALFFITAERWIEKRHSLKRFSDSRFLEIMREKLELSNEQYISIAAVFENDDTIQEANRLLIADKFRNLDSLLLNDRFDESAVRKILEDIDSIKREERIRLMKKRYEIDKFLTPEQRLTLNNHMKKKMKRFRDRFEPDGKRLPEND